MSVAPPWTRSTRDRQVSSGRSSRAWWWTALTGAALLLLLTVHMVAHHFVVEDVGGLRSYEQVLDYIANPVIFTLELFFLIVVTIHALLGLRGVLFDLGIGVRSAGGPISCCGSSASSRSATASSSWAPSPRGREAPHRGGHRPRLAQPLGGRRRSRARPPDGWTGRPHRNGGGLDDPERSMGTDAVLVMEAIERAWSDDGVLVVMDLGSAVLSAEMALDLVPVERRDKVLLTDAPLVEGAVSAAVSLGSARTSRRSPPRLAEGCWPRPRTSGWIGRRRPRTPKQPPRRPLLPPGWRYGTPMVCTHGRRRAWSRPPPRSTPACASPTSRPEEVRLAPGASTRWRRSAWCPATRSRSRRRVGRGARPSTPSARSPSVGSTKEWNRPRSKKARTGHPGRSRRGSSVCPRHQGSRWARSDGSTCPRSMFPNDRRATRPRRTGAWTPRSPRPATSSTSGSRWPAPARTRRRSSRRTYLFLDDQELIAPARRAIATARRQKAWRCDRGHGAGMGTARRRVPARPCRSRSVGARAGSAPGHRSAETEAGGAGVVVAPELSPADAAALDPAVALGIVTAFGGPTSHAAVLACSIGTPPWSGRARTSSISPRARRSRRLHWRFAPTVRTRARGVRFVRERRVAEEAARATARSPPPPPTAS